MERIPLNKVIEVDNYRTEYPQDHITALTVSMAESGYDESYPIGVTALPSGDYKIVYGHCRTRAWRNVCGYSITGRDSLGTIPAVILTETDPALLALAQLRENENRRDPNDIDRARGYKSALDKGATIEALCKAVGKTRDYVERRIALLSLLPDVQELVAKQQIGITFALAMSKLDSNFQRIAIATYRDMKSPTPEEPNAVCSALLEKQNQCSLFDLALFNGQPVNAILEQIKIERKKTRAELEAELTKMQAARKRDRENALKVLNAQRAEIERLTKLLSAVPAMAGVAA